MCTIYTETRVCWYPFLFIHTFVNHLVSSSHLVLFKQLMCVLDTRGTETSLANSQTANVLLTEGTSIRNIIMPTTAVPSLFNVTDGRRSVSLAEGIVNNNNPTLSKWSCERDSSECLQ